jgi:hypothetical protein
MIQFMHVIISVITYKTCKLPTKLHYSLSGRTMFKSPKIYTCTLQLLWMTNSKYSQRKTPIILKHVPFHERSRLTPDFGSFHSSTLQFFQKCRTFKLLWDLWCTIICVKIWWLRYVPHHCTLLVSLDSI